MGGGLHFLKHHPGQRSGSAKMPSLGFGQAGDRLTFKEMRVRTEAEEHVFWKVIWGFCKSRPLVGSIYTVNKLMMKD